MIVCSSAQKLGCQSHQVYFPQLINLNHQFSFGGKSSHYSCHFFLAVLQFQAQLQSLVSQKRHPQPLEDEAGSGSMLTLLFPPLPAVCLQI